jgi:hypothetical protein
MKRLEGASLWVVVGSLSLRGATLSAERHTSEPVRCISSMQPHAFETGKSAATIQRCTSSPERCSAAAQRCIFKLQTRSVERLRWASEDPEIRL